jgi:two-component system CheB/CheR fusion protein
MPDSAVAAGAVDLYVRVEDMPDRILAARHIRLATRRDGDEAAQDISKIRTAICDVLRSRLGHDFSQYKQQTFIRRVQRRMQVTRVTKYDDYVRLLETDRE